MKRIIFALLALLLLTVPQLSAPAAAQQENCLFFTETGGGQGGFSVCDDADARFRSAFESWGLLSVGYPVSQRYTRDGFVTQAFQKAIMQWRPDTNSVALVNIFDDLHNGGFDQTLLERYQTPNQLPAGWDGSGTFSQIVQKRQGLLDERPALRAAYFASDEPLTFFGLPTSLVEDMDSHYAIRLQRAVLQEWKIEVPWAKAGEVTIANGGDIAKTLGGLPAEALTPEASAEAPPPAPTAAPAPSPGGAQPVSVASIDEVEPNESAETGQGLATIGAANPINGAINSPGDVDWFSFEAQPGKSYVVELFNVDLSLAAEGTNCSGLYEGVGLKVYDPSLSKIETQCRPSGSGNVQSIVQFRTETSGRYHIQVIPNAGNVVGNYALRVLPEYSDANAWWDESTFEPNNRAYQALEITPGQANALTSEIEARDGGYHTNFVDVDWYRFNAQAGKSYVVELFNVDISLATEGGNCSGLYEGVGLNVYNPSLSEKVATECRPSGAGNVQSIVQFRTESSGWYHIQVIPNANSVVGRYNIRVLPQYDDPNASWDESTLEPNNLAPQAVEITPNQALTSAIGARDGNYITNAVDVDWYRFNAIGGQSYAIELFNVDSTLTDPEGGNCSGLYQGVGLRVHDSSIISNPRANYLATECDPNGTGEVHNRLQFRPETTGVYHILLIPNADSASGNYSIRVLGE